MDGRGVPLSIVVTAANVHDGKRLDTVLNALVVKRPRTPVRRNKHRAPTLAIAARRIRGSSTPKATLPMSSNAGREPKASGAIHSRRPEDGSWRCATVGSIASASYWCDTRNCERSLMAHNHLAAAIIAFRKVPARVNIIYG